jgi:hypothetical protein
MAGKYVEGKIYKITSQMTNKIYIGSTCQSLYMRFNGHKTEIKTKNISSSEILQYGDAKIELIEAFPCNSRKELEKREGYYIKENCNIVVNKSVAGRTYAEYYVDKFSEISVKRSEFYKNNKDKILETVTKYRIENRDKINEKIKCECGGKFTRNHRAGHYKTSKHLKFLNS